jgi:hypothetical protein
MRLDLAVLVAAGSPALSIMGHGMQQFVHEAVAPSDLVAAITFGQSGLRVLVGLTCDRVQLGRAVESLGIVETDRLRDPMSLAWGDDALFRGGHARSLAAALRGRSSGARGPATPSGVNPQIEIP